MKKGFTLIELSIVLVIIGLLIGGILVGQSLVESAKILKLTKQLTEYNHATSLFVERFKYVPGDFPKAVEQLAADLNGDGDKILDSRHSADPKEYLNYFQHLQNAKLLNHTEKALPIPPNTHYARVGYNVPETAFQGVGILAWQANANDRLNFQIGSSKNGDYGDTLWSPGLTAAVSLSVDTKIDDGVADTGNFISLDGYSAAVADTANPNSAGNTNIDCVTGGSYDVNNPATGCRNILYYESFGNML